MEPLLAGFQRFGVVRRGETAGAEESEEGVQAAAQQAAGFTGRGQFPGGYIHAGRAGGLKHADGNSHYVVDDQVGENDHIPAFFAHSQSLGAAVAGDEVILDAADFGFGVIAEVRVPHCDGASVDGIVLHHAVPVAQGAPEAAAVAGHADAGLVSHIVKIGLVGGQGVVAVNAVFGQQFPVGLDGVAVGTGDDAHTLGGLVGHQVQVFGGAGQVFPQGFGFLVKADEDEALVAVKPGGAQVHFGAVKIGPVTGDVGHSDEFAGGVEAPGVVEALEDLGVAPVGAADEGAAMGAGVVEYPQFAVAVAGEEEGALGDHPAHIVAGVGDFGFVAQVKPAAVEDAFPLQLVNFRRHHAEAMHFELAQVGAVIDQVGDVHNIVSRLAARRRAVRRRQRLARRCGTQSRALHPRHRGRWGCPGFPVRARGGR